MSFALSYLSLGEQLVLLYTSGTRHLINETLVSVLHAHLRHLDLAVRADKVTHSLYQLQCCGSALLSMWIRVQPLTDCGSRSRVPNQCGSGFESGSWPAFKSQSKWIRIQHFIWMRIRIQIQGANPMRIRLRIQILVRLYTHKKLAFYRKNIIKVGVPLTSACSTCQREKV